MISPDYHVVVDTGYMQSGHRAGSLYGRLDPAEASYSNVVSIKPRHECLIWDLTRHVQLSEVRSSQTALVVDLQVLTRLLSTSDNAHSHEHPQLC